MNEKVKQALETVRAALSDVPIGTTDCQGYKCRQPNCFACTGEPRPLDGGKAGRAALTTLQRYIEELGAENERLRARSANEWAAYLANEKRLEAENERLRRLLSNLVWTADNEPGQWPELDEAAAALHPTEEE